MRVLRQSQCLPRPVALWTSPSRPRGPWGVPLRELVDVDPGCFREAPLSSWCFPSRLGQGPSSWLQESRTLTGQSLIA